MGAEVKLKNKLYKVFLLYLKFIPITLAIIDFVNTLLSLFDINVILLSYIGGVSLIPIIFVYIAGAVFRFCCYHKVFLHYVVINNIINILDLYIGFNVNTLTLISLLLVLFFIAVCIASISYIRNRKHVKDN